MRWIYGQCSVRDEFVKTARSRPSHSFGAPTCPSPGLQSLLCNVLRLAGVVSGGVTRSVGFGAWYEGSFTAVPCIPA